MRNIIKSYNSNTSTLARKWNLSRRYLYAVVAVVEQTIKREGTDIELHAKDMIHEMGLDTPTAWSLISNALLNRGIIEVSVSKIDRRMSHITPTPLAWDIHGRYMKIIEDVEREVEGVYQNSSGSQ